MNVLYQGRARYAREKGPRNAFVESFNPQQGRRPEGMLLCEVVPVRTRGRNEECFYLRLARKPYHMELSDYVKRSEVEECGWGDELMREAEKHAMTLRRNGRGMLANTKITKISDPDEINLICIELYGL